MKPLNNTSTFKRWAVLVTVVFSAANVARAAQGILDYNRFMSEIEPLLLTKTYASPGPGAMTCLDCHGDSNHAAYSAFPLTAGEPRQNFVNTAARVEIDNPDTSSILLVPLATSAGGTIAHGAANSGGKQFANTTTDPNYKLIQAWILDARNSSIGARVSRADAHPNPFRFHTDIVYFLSTSANDVKVSLYSFDGHELQTFSGTTRVGANRITWDGRDEKGEPLPTGVYVYRVKAYFDDGTHVFQGSVVYTP